VAKTTRRQAYHLDNKKPAEARLLDCEAGTAVDAITATINPISEQVVDVQGAQGECHEIVCPSMQEEIDCQ
jgi:hypothetical protein